MYRYALGKKHNIKELIIRDAVDKPLETYYHILYPHEPMKFPGLISGLQLFLEKTSVVDAFITVVPGEDSVWEAILLFYNLEDKVGNKPDIKVPYEFHSDEIFIAPEKSAFKNGEFLLSCEKIGYRIRYNKDIFSPAVLDKYWIDMQKKTDIKDNETVGKVVARTAVLAEPGTNNALWAEINFHFSSGIDLAYWRLMMAEFIEKITGEKTEEIVVPDNSFFSESNEES